MKYLRFLLFTSVLAVLLENTTAGVVLNTTHMYDWNGVTDAITINVTVSSGGGLYTWTYGVTNNGFNPSAGNGFSGFELALPASVSDIGNVTAPNSNWVIDCCSGEPVEWDILDSVGPGILVGESGTFSFTTLPRFITNSTGWFHTWQSDVQTNITLYSDTPGAVGPEAPDVLTPPIPEPGNYLLFASGSLLLLLWRKVA
jgi:hypothetical protein